MSINDEFFLWRHEKREGPFDIHQITEMWDSHQIDGATLLARNGSKFACASEWVSYMQEAKASPLKPPLFTVGQLNKGALSALVVLVVTSILFAAYIIVNFVRFNP